MNNQRDNARKEIERLVSAFRANVAQHRRNDSTYNETQLRTDFLDPLLKALGWDIDNSKSLPQDLREIVQEPTIEINEDKSSKKPDYAVRVGRQSKFFIEAKKPSVKVGEDKSASFQTRRYGFSASHPVAVLSNFDKTIVYGTTEPPNQQDDARIGEVVSYSFEDLLGKFDDLYDKLSREAVYSGHFDKVFGAEIVQTGYQHFDRYFLRQIETWRESLASDIALRNAHIGNDEINFFVQRILNRIIFLRICEDRNLEKYETLRSFGDNTTYESLKGIFEQAEDRYNSGLFDLLEDPTMNIQVESNTLISVLNDLYYPKSPYTFAVIDVSVLGAIYEQFIGRRIEIETNRVIKLNEKPEVRISGGVFVTPLFIVDEVVRRTLEPLFNGKTVEEAAQLRIADICCGSGTFLLGAYEFLQNWHLEHYLKDGAAKHNGQRIYQIAGGDWRLTLEEKRRILLKNIFGADVDELAVEVTRFGLLLKIMEDEDSTSVKAYRTKHNQRALPVLDDNIKCGNSLVSPDKLKNVIPSPSDDLLTKINPFDWPAEFPAVFAQNGFDAIVGNPPYIRIQNMVKYAGEEALFYQSKHSGYVCAQKDSFDKYQVFVERAIFLLREGGRVGYIVPHKFLTLRSGRALRGLIAQGRYLREIVHFGVEQVFRNSTTYTCLLFLEKRPGTDFKAELVSHLAHWQYSKTADSYEQNLESLGEDTWVLVSPKWNGLFDRLKKDNPKTLGELADIFVGVQTSADKIYIIKPTRFTATAVFFNDVRGREWEIEMGILRPCLYDEPLQRFTAPMPNAYIIFPYTVKGLRATIVDMVTMGKQFPKALTYLQSFQPELAKRNLQGSASDPWYRYGRNQSLAKFSGEKIILPILSTNARYTLDKQNIVVTGGGNGPYYLVSPKLTVTLSIQYMMAMLSYPVLEAIVRSSSSHFRGDYYSHGRQFIAPLPIRILDLNDEVQKATHDQISNLVDQLIALDSKVKSSHTPRIRLTFIRQRHQLENSLFEIIDRLYDVETDVRKSIQGTLNSDTVQEDGSA